MTNKVLFIINKFSGAGYRPEVEGRIITTCGKLNLECSIEFTRERGHATELAREAATQDYHTVFAVGGDGTVNEVAQGLVNTGATMGILPKGSGNGLARHLGVPMDFFQSLGSLLSHKTIDMDTIRVNGKLAVNISGVGFDGHVASLFGKNGKRGLVGYTRLVIREFRSYHEFDVALVVDGETIHHKAFIVAFANSSQFGNNARVAPKASVCDALVDVCVIKKVPFTHAVGFMQRMFTGTLDRSSFVDIRQAKRIELSFPHPMAFHIDGEAMPATDKFLIEIQPGSLRMRIPDNKRIRV